MPIGNMNSKPISESRSRSRRRPAGRRGSWSGGTVKSRPLVDALANCHGWSRIAQHWASIHAAPIRRASRIIHEAPLKSRPTANALRGRTRNRSSRRPAYLFPLITRRDPMNQRDGGEAPVTEGVKRISWRGAAPQPGPMITRKGLSRNLGPPLSSIIVPSPIWINLAMGRDRKLDGK